MVGSTVRGVAPTSGQPEFYASSSGTKERKEAYFVSWYKNVELRISEEEKREIEDKAVEVVSRMICKVRELEKDLENYSELITCLEIRISDGWIWLAIPVQQYFNPIIYWEAESSENIEKDYWRVELAEVEILEAEEDA